MDHMSTLYIAANASVFVSYIPQIIALAKDTTHSENMPLSSWVLWLAAATISLMYFATRVHDPLTILSSGLNFTGCAAVFFLLLFNRYMKDEGSCFYGFLTARNTD